MVKTADANAPGSAEPGKSSAQKNSGLSDAGAAVKKQMSKVSGGWATGDNELRIGLILVGIICIVMAVALVYMAKRGD